MLEAAKHRTQSPRDARLAIIGAGTLGSAVCRLLVSSGWGSVLVIDPDRLEARNLITSRLYAQLAGSAKIVGSSKAEVLAGYAADEGQPDWACRTCEIADVGLAELGARDVLICCADNTLARVETAYAAWLLDLPMLDAGVFPDGIAEGRVSVYPSGHGAACALCGIGERRRAELLAYALSPALGCAVPAADQAMTGVFGAVEAVASALMEELRQVLRIPPVRSYARRLKASGRSFTSETISLTRSETCPWHSAVSPASRVLPGDEPIGAAFRGLPAGTILDLPWPLALRSRCLACGAESDRPGRLAWVRRRAVCAACGIAGRMTPVDCISSIREGDRCVSRAPQQLGLPRMHLLLSRQSLL